MLSTKNKRLYEKACLYSQQGKYEQAFMGFSKLIDNLTAGAPDPKALDEETRETLLHAAQEWAGLQRWRGNYPEAIQKLTQILQIFPEDEAAFRSSIAVFQVESGQADAGIAELTAQAEKDPENIYPWITLAANELWLGKMEQAETTLKKALSLPTAERFGQAFAYKLLFDIYGKQERFVEAVSAWEESQRLDPAAGATVPAVIRMLIYWRRFQLAASFIPREPSEIKRAFYRDLIQFEDMGSNDGLWEWIVDIEPETMAEGQDEFAEACLRMYQPTRALAVVEPLIDKGEITRQRMLLAGIGWAEKRMLKRAVWALEQAVRMADLERPRASRPDGVGGRILDATSRMLFGDCTMHADIRAELNRFFIPQKV